MKIVILDGYTENPGDLSWNGFEALGEVTVYDRTPFADGSGEIVRRAKGADILIVNKTPLKRWRHLRRNCGISAYWPQATMWWILPRPKRRACPCAISQPTALRRWPSL